MIGFYFFFMKRLRDMKTEEPKSFYVIRELLVTIVGTVDMVKLDRLELLSIAVYNIDEVYHVHIEYIIMYPMVLRQGREYISIYLVQTSIWTPEAFLTGSDIYHCQFSGTRVYCFQSLLNQ